MSEPRLVLVSNRRLDGDLSGSASYLMAFLKLAADQGYKIDIVMAPDTAFGSRPWCAVDPRFAALGSISWPDTLMVRGKFVSTLPQVWGRFCQRLVKAALLKIGLKPDHPWVQVRSLLGVVPEASELKRLALAVKKLSPTIVAVEYSSLGPLFDALGPVDPPGRFVLVHDLFAARAEAFRRAGLAPDHEAPSLEEEADRMRCADVVVHASHEEMDDIGPLLPRASHVWMPPELPIVTASLQPDASSPVRALFVGGGHAGNRDALTWVLTDIWPKVRARIGDAAQLQIAGSIGEVLGLSTDPTRGIEILGRVDDLASLAGPHVIGLAPMRLQSGISIKLAEYVAFGMPVVATSTASAAYGLTLAGSIAIADDADTMVEVLVRLFTDQGARAHLAASARQAADGLRRYPAVPQALSQYRS